MLIVSLYFRHKDVSLGRKRDYPHLARKEERMPEYAEERRGLVGRSEDDSSSDSGKEDGLSRSISLICSSLAPTQLTCPLCRSGRPLHSRYPEMRA